jgi:hypothetical protein
MALRLLLLAWKKSGVGPAHSKRAQPRTRRYNGSTAIIS